MTKEQRIRRGITRGLKFADAKPTKEQENETLRRIIASVQRIMAE